MTNVFSTGPLKLIEALTFTKTLFAFDFDGTLAPIVKNPEDAVANPTTLRLLQSLSKKGPLAIISGRSLSDLRSRIKIKDAYMVGNHGLEGIHFKKKKLDLAHTVTKNWQKDLSYLIGNQNNPLGISIENKEFSLALHFRGSKNKKTARAAIFEAISNLKPAPRVILGKSVINLLPAGAPHKGVALLELMMHVGVNSAFYIGDDDTDEDVFTLPEQRIVTVRVGKKHASRAQFFIENQKAINKLLKCILDFYE